MKVWLTIVAVMALLIALGPLLAGCGAAPGTGKPGSVTPAVTTLTGEQILQMNCVVCHDRDRIDNAVHDQAGWESTIDRMIGKGATVSQAEKSVLAAYLANR